MSIDIPEVPKKPARAKQQPTGDYTPEKIEADLESWGIGYTEVHKSKWDSEVQFNLDSPCPLCGSKTSNPAVFCRDGIPCFSCFEAEPGCADTPKKTYADLREHFDPRPVIRLGPDQQATVQQVIEALAGSDTIYQRANLLVRPVFDPPPPSQAVFDNGAPRYMPHSTASLRTALTAHIRTERFDQKKGKWVRVLPPDALVTGVKDAAEYPGVYQAMSIVDHPVLRPDGSIFAGPGYDPETGVYYQSDATYPDLMDPQAALALLDDLFHDFCFELPAHRSAAYSNLLSLMGRTAYAGPSPLSVWDANRSRTGKGLGTDLITIIAEGREAVRVSGDMEPDEMRKKLTSLIVSGARYVIFDNIKEKFGGAAIEAAIMTGRWSDRLLGVNVQVDLPFSLVCMATCNSGSFTTDMAKRINHIRLHTWLERPEERTDFRHKRVKEYAKQERPRLVMAALSIIAAYIRAGEPATLPQWGGFEGWSKLIRGSLVWLGRPDPAEARANLERSSDTEQHGIEALVDAWSEFPEPIRVSELFDELRNKPLNDDPDPYPKMRAFIAEIVGADRDKQNFVRKMLRQHRRQNVNDFMFDCTEHKIPKWTLNNVPGV